MYLNININNRVNVKVAPVSIAEMRSIQKDIRQKGTEIIGTGTEQVARVTAEGDTQVARVIVYADEVEVFVDEAEDYNGQAEAEALNADSWANEILNTDVIKYTWDNINDVMTQAPIPNARSAFHWQETAKTVSAGLAFQGTWDSVDCSLPATPIPPTGELVNGYFYIVTSTTGDQTGCPNLGVGDWLVWSGDLDGDVVVEGAWQLINWEFAWDAISGVTVDGNPTANGQDLTSVGVSYTKSEQDAIDLIQDTAIALNTAKVSISAAQASEIASNTLKVSYKDTMTFDGTTLAITIG